MGQKILMEKNQQEIAIQEVFVVQNLEYDVEKYNHVGNLIFSLKTKQSWREKEDSEVKKNKRKANQGWKSARECTAGQ